MNAEIIKNSIGPFDSEEKIRFWFDFFNKEVFYGSLKYFDDVIIGEDLSYELWGSLYYYEANEIEDGSPEQFHLAIQPFLNFRDFLGTLVHEMVHLFQGQIQKNFAFPEPENDITFRLFDDRVSPYGITAI